MDKSSSPILKIESLYYSYHKTNWVLSNFSLAIMPNEIIGIVGPNGIGKSTLMKCMAGILNPSKGSVYFDAQNINRIPNLIRAQKISYLPPAALTTYNLKVRSIVEMGRFCYAAPKFQPSCNDIQKINAAIQNFNLCRLEHKGVMDISAGERQRVYLARVWTQDAEIMILDEPFEHLDKHNKESLLKQIRHAALNDNKTIVFCSHEFELVTQLATRIIRL